MSENKNQQSPAPFFPTSDSCSPRGNHFQHFWLFLWFGGICLCVSLKKKKCYLLLWFDFLAPPLLFQYSYVVLFGWISIQFLHYYDMSTAFPVKLPRLLCFLFGFFFLPGITNCFDYCCFLRLLHEYSHWILRLLLTFSFFLLQV